MNDKTSGRVGILESMAIVLAVAADPMTAKPRRDADATDMLLHD